MSFPQIWRTMTQGPDTPDRQLSSLGAFVLLVLIFLPLPLSLISIEAFKWPIYIGMVVLAQALVRFTSIREVLLKALGRAGSVALFVALLFLFVQAGRTIWTFQDDSDPLLIIKPLMLSAGICWIVLASSLVRDPSNPLRLNAIPVLRATALLIVVLIGLSQIAAVASAISDGVFPALTTRQFNRAYEAIAIALFLVPLIWRLSAGAVLMLVAGAWLVSFFGLGVIPNRGIGHVHSETVLAALPAGAAVYLMAHHAPRATVWLVSTGTCLITVLAPWLFQWLYALAVSIGGLPKKLMVRLEIYEAVSRSALEAPLIGHGLSYLRFSDDLELTGPLIKMPPAHPHNAFLQLWQDCGLIGVMMALVLIVGATRYCLRLPESAVAPLMGFWTAMVLALGVTHALWQSWWLSGLICISILAAIASNLAKP